MDSLIINFIAAIWILLPAYAANIFPPLANGKIPIDGGRKVKEWRILGDGKTWEGFLLGIFVGTLVGLAEAYLSGPISTSYNIALPQITILTAFLIPLGALLGDMAGSFIKRRFRMSRGGDAPFLDQLDFLMGALLLSHWFIELNGTIVIIMFIITPVLHRVSNIIGYWLRVKREPW
jgi:CDP-2,3-bis-(O-geranylgeranyl)-sn-glycerol synthase